MIQLREQRKQDVSVGKARRF